MRKVIVNITPIIALSKIGELHLLKDLYRRRETNNGQINTEWSVYKFGSSRKRFKNRSRIIFLPLITYHRKTDFPQYLI